VPTQKPATAKKKPTRSGLKVRRQVALLAAHGKSNPEIARELSLTERRIKQIMAEPETQAMEGHFAKSVDRQRMAAESILIDTAVEKTAAGDIAWAALLEQRITNAERRGGGAGGAQVQVNVQSNTVSTSFEDLVRSVAVQEPLQAIAEAPAGVGVRGK